MLSFYCSSAENVYTMLQNACQILCAVVDVEIILLLRAMSAVDVCRYVMDVYMPRDRLNRAEHRGFGFVTFETEAAIIRIASYGGHMIR